LKISGRLIIPVGGMDGTEDLIKLTRRSAQEFQEEHLGAVRFVPLVGADSWIEDGRRSSSTHIPGAARKQKPADPIVEAAEPLPAFEDPAFGRLFDRFADKRVVLIGEASHGTSEFYQARAG
jgi:hypothetical protein